MRKVSQQRRHLPPRLIETSFPNFVLWSSVRDVDSVTLSVSFSPSIGGFDYSHRKSSLSRIDPDALQPRGRLGRPLSRLGDEPAR